MKLNTQKIFIISLIIINSSASLLTAKPTIAFGYLNNENKNPAFNYLEIIFPKSFANSLAVNFDVNIKKPEEVEKELRDQKLSLKKDYDFFELPDLIEKLDSDLFIWGSFLPISGSQIKIKLNIYIDGYSEIFSFTNVGKMETQIAKLVDRVTIIVLNFMDKENVYKSRKILPGTSLAVLTNLNGEEQNRLLIAFMQKGYRISCFQNNDINNYIDDSVIEKFKHIKTGRNSFDIITDWRKSKFYHGTWTGNKYNERVKYLKSIYEKYDVNFGDIKNDKLQGLYDSFEKNVDILLIVGFSDNRKSSWVRAIDLKERELVWMQSNIESDMLSFDPVMDNVMRIVDGMTADVKDPFSSGSGSEMKK